MSPSTIEWTDETWNPTVGCSRVSPGCDHCYAIGVAHRAMQPAHAGLTERTTEGIDWTGEVRLLPERLPLPLTWREPRRVFVDSMSDLFHQDVPQEFIGHAFAVMAEASQHTFQVLTKRPQRAAGLDLYSLALEQAEKVNPENRLGINWQIAPFRNVWLGTSIESDKYTWRANHLRRAQAAVRFLSLEPLLGPLPSLDLTDIDWVIAGGESGPGARPVDPGWVREIRDRCSELGIPFHFKQWGTWVPYEPDAQPPFFASQHGDLIDGHYLPADLSEHEPTHGWWWPDVMAEPIYRRVGKKVAGRQLDGRTWDEIPESALT